MNMLYLAAAVAAPTIQKGEFAERLGSMFWTAYGKPLKFVAIVALCVLVGGPLLAFLRRLVR